MIKFTGFKRTSLILVLVALLSFFSLSPAYAQSDTKALKAKLTQLESQLGNLEMVVKSLALQIQQVSDASKSTVQQFGPRLYSVEQIVKDNGFQVKRLDGTVATLSHAVKQLADLPGEVAQQKADLASLSDQLTKTTQELSNRIKANELGISKIKEGSDHAVALTNAMQANLGSLLSRMDTAEGQLSDLQSSFSNLSANTSSSISDLSTKLDGGMSDLSAKIGSSMSKLAAKTDSSISDLAAKTDSSIGGLAARLDDADKRLSQLQDTANQVSSMTGTIGSLQASVAQLASNLDKQAAGIARLQDVVKRLGEFKQLQGVAERVQANSTQLKALQAQLQALSQKAKVQRPQPQQPHVPADVTKKVDRLTAKISDVLIEAENNKKSLTDLQGSLAGLKAGVAQQVQSALASVPSRSDIQNVQQQVTQLQQLTAKQIKRAEMKADAANGLALIGLLAGLGAVAVALLR
ncbi:MAG TPA: hypothetical protein ENI60_03375 [Candidatus Fraserbacteria bacterium]|nr:hypothetical protein [Candidatus Fraserbacteria bacterium]